MTQLQFDFQEHERIERVRAYLDKAGFYFCSNSDQERDVKLACAMGFLQPVDVILPPSKRDRGTRHWFVRPQLKSFHELPAGLYRHLIEKVAT
jgi:hypothetical protein